MAVNVGLLEFCRSAAYLRICPGAETLKRGYFMILELFVQHLPETLLDHENWTPELFGWAE